MTHRVYLSCPEGHFFQDLYCPVDGSTHPDHGKVLRAVADLARAGRTPSIAALRESGVPETALHRLMVVEFGAVEAAFEALIVESFFERDRWVPPHLRGRTRS